MKKRTGGKPPMKPLVMARQCGACFGCCVVFEVPELEKKRRVPCHYLKPDADTAGMCSIWDAPTLAKESTMLAGRQEDGTVYKPHVCTAFHCLWKQNLAPDSLYPLSSGVVLTMAKDDATIMFMELRLGAADEGDVPDFIATLSANGIPCIIVPWTEPGTDERDRRLIPPAPGTNALYDAELALMMKQHPGQYVENRTHIPESI